MPDWWQVLRETTVITKKSELRNNLLFSYCRSTHELTPLPALWSGRGGVSHKAFQEAPKTGSFSNLSFVVWALRFPVCFKWFLQRDPGSSLVHKGPRNVMSGCDQGLLGAHNKVMGKESRKVPEHVSIVRHIRIKVHLQRFSGFQNEVEYSQEALTSRRFLRFERQRVGKGDIRRGFTECTGNDFLGGGTPWRL